MNKNIHFFYRDKKWLYQKYIVEELCPREISKICHCHITIIPEWLRKFRISVRNISEAKMGYKVTEKTKEKIRDHPYNKNREGWIFSSNKKNPKIRIRKYRHSEKIKKQISKSRIGKYGGKNCPAWKGGVTPMHDIIRSSTEYNNWRDAVFKRDNYTCQRCLAKSGFGKAVYLEAHHILSFTDFPEERFILDNGATLCRPCHGGINNEGLSWPTEICESISL